jgi:hypothetical protein
MRYRIESECRRTGKPCRSSKWYGASSEKALSYFVAQLQYKYPSERYWVAMDSESSEIDRDGFSETGYYLDRFASAVESHCSKA